MTTLPVVAAIPNYNMASELKELLPQVVRQGYSDIFVLDDASTDNSRDVVESFGDKVTFVVGDINKGAGANRNRILQALTYDALIHFLDADVRLETTDTAERIRDLVPRERFGFIGGLVKNSDGTQLIWNYGPVRGLKNDVSAQIQQHIGNIIVSNPEKAKQVRKRFNGLLRDWPDPLSTPTRREAYWTCEPNIIFRSDIFHELGGFDESLLETEILELAIRSHRLGLKSYFDPTISVLHTEARN
jgi:GT2 family glycosyltransferase